MSQVNKSWKISQNLDTILNSQRPQHDKTRIGFKGESSSWKKNANEEIQRSHVDIVCNPPNEEKSFHLEQISTYNNPRNEMNLSPRKNIAWSQGYPNRYQAIFIGYYFYCEKFGHQARNCKTYKDNSSRRYKTNYQNKSLGSK